MQAKSILALIVAYGLIVAPIAYAAWTTCHTVSVALRHAQVTAAASFGQ